MFFTSRYLARDRKGGLIERDILLHNSNLFDLDGKEHDVFGHKMLFLNHHYLKATTPAVYRDWLTLVRESIKSPMAPQVNWQNTGVKKAAELIDFEHLTPEERTESKNRAAAESAKLVYEQEMKRQAEMAIARKMLARGESVEKIALYTDLTPEQIASLKQEGE